jgi:hypothetical protein
VVVFSVLDLSSPKIICNLLAGGNWAFDFERAHNFCSDWFAFGEGQARAAIFTWSIALDVNILVCIWVGFSNCVSVFLCPSLAEAEKVIHGFELTRRGRIQRI